MTSSEENSSEIARITQLKDLIVTALDTHKGEDIIDIDLSAQSTIADYMIVASGTSARHVASLAHKVMDEINMFDPGRRQRVEGMSEGDWVLVDAGDIIIHLFRPEVRSFYSLEKMWMSSQPASEHKHMVSKRSADSD